jgi:hypothetical protein
MTLEIAVLDFNQIYNRRLSPIPRSPEFRGLSWVAMACACLDRIAMNISAATFRTRCVEFQLKRMGNGAGHTTGRSLRSTINAPQIGRTVYVFVTGIGVKQPIPASAEHQITYRFVGPFGRLGEETVLKTGRTTGSFPPPPFIY